MIENLPAASTETKYCRIPQWLYEAGVSLQAIAAYGWLHGKYGHFKRITPSYATLAKELGVSRGSVIAYVKELVAVGAVKVSGGGQAGRTVNEYVIAFNAPFAAVRGGQNTDQVVSGLTSTGQNADRGGQRAVPEEDVLKKTYKDSLSEPPHQRASTPPAASGERETEAAPTSNKPDAPTLVAEAWATTRGGHRNPMTEAKIRTAAALLLAANWPLADVTALAEDMARTHPTWTDLGQHADHWQAARTAPADVSKRSALPDWCTECDEYDRTVAIFDGNGHESSRPCTVCNPYAKEKAA